MQKFSGGKAHLQGKLQVCAGALGMRTAEVGTHTHTHRFSSLVH